MRPRPRLRFWPTQRPCFRVSSSCTLYEVFGNFAWRSAPPRKRVTQSGKAPALRDREVPPRKSRRGARLRGNGDRGTCLTEGESFTLPLVFILFQEIPRQARNDTARRQERPWPHFSFKQSACSFMGKTQAFCWFAPHLRKAELPPKGKPTRFLFQDSSLSFGMTTKKTAVWRFFVFYFP